MQKDKYNKLCLNELIQVNKKKITDLIQEIQELLGKKNSYITIIEKLKIIKDLILMIRSNYDPIILLIKC